jgi:hypothetical protein
MVNWVCNGKEMLSHDDFTDDVVGFIYLITYTNGQQYIGKKLIRSIVKLKPTKEQLAIRKNYSRKEMRNKPFVNYVGSHKTDKYMEIQSREMIEICSDKINLTYCEIKWMMKYDVLNNDKYLNGNIAGKFFQGKIKRGI